MLMKRAAWMAGAFVAVAACDKEKQQSTSEDVVAAQTEAAVDQTEQTLTVVLEAVGDALDGVLESDAMSSTADALSAAGDTLGGDEEETADPGTRDMEDCADEPDADGCMEEGPDFAEGVQEALQEIKETLLAVENSGACAAEGTQLVCLVQGDAKFCTDIETTCSGEGEAYGCVDEEVPDDVCMERLAELQIRVAFELVDESETAVALEDIDIDSNAYGVNVYLLIGPERLNPFKLSLRPGDSLNFNVGASIEGTAYYAAVVPSLEWIADTMTEIEGEDSDDCADGEDDCESDDCEGDDCDDDDFELPETFSLAGVVRAKLMKSGERAVTAELGVVEKVEVKLGDAAEVLAGTEDAVYLSLSVGASDPMVAVDLDGTPDSESIDVEVDVGAVEIAAGLGMFEEDEPCDVCMGPDCGGDMNGGGEYGEGDGEYGEGGGEYGEGGGEYGEGGGEYGEGGGEYGEGGGEYGEGGGGCSEDENEGPEGIISIYLAGLTGEATLTPGQDELFVSGLSLGGAQSTVEYDDGAGPVPVLAIDINEDFERVFDFTITPVELDDGEQTATFTFDPAFVASVAINTTPLGGEDNPNLDETITLSLTGAPGSVTPLPDVGIQVTKGTLQLSSTNADVEGVTVNEGMCLVADDGGDEPDGGGEGEGEAPDDDGEGEGADEEDEHPFNMLSEEACE